MNRTGRGQFQKGRSGNAGGRPKAERSLRDAAREHMEFALTTLVKAAKKGSVTAAIAILDRGYGRPPQAVDMRVLLNKRLAELSPEELRMLEEHLVAMGAEQPPEDEAAVH
jgi:hypothetical protein